MDARNNISIAVASDNHYAILIVALLTSIDVNHKTDEHIDFHIIDDGISRKFRKKLSGIIDPTRITLYWHKSNEIVPTNITIPIDNSAFPLTAYMRVFSPYIVSPTVKKLIYLDVDTIVQDDISKLWNIPLNGYTVGAVQDIGKTVDCSWAGIPNYMELGLTSDTKYFNSGVLLIDTHKWLSEDISGQVISALSKYKQHVRLADQYGLNVALANKWLELDPKWNWPAFNEDEGAYLIHFLDIKPIFTSYRSQEKYKDSFFHYLDMTPWKNFKPINGNQRIFRKIFNVMKKKLMKI